MRLLNLCSEDDAKLVEWVQKKTDKYTSAAMQNEMVKVMGLSILRTISGHLQTSCFYNVMVDETTDVANTEQVVICLRWVSQCFEVHEDFIGLYEVDSTEAKKIFASMHVHKSHTNNLSLVDIANDFVADNEHRKQFFGPEFKPSELLNQI